jgi:hypothetical protein
LVTSLSKDCYYNYMYNDIWKNLILSSKKKKIKVIKVRCSLLCVHAYLYVVLGSVKITIHWNSTIFLHKYVDFLVFTRFLFHESNNLSYKIWSLKSGDFQKEHNYVYLKKCTHFFFFIYWFLARSNRCKNRVMVRWITGDGREKFLTVFSAAS